MELTLEQKREERRRRHAAWETLEKTYESLRPCPECGGSERRVNGGACRPCSTKKASARQKANPVAARERNRAWRKANPDLVREQDRRAYAKKTPEQKAAAREKARLRREANKEATNAKRRAQWAADPEAARAKRRAKRESNPESARESSKRWAEKNTPRITAKSKARKAAKRRQTPVWLTNEDKATMVATYRQAAEYGELVGEPYHVDHIVPLKGETVSGLHVPWNLQVMRGAENVRKSNRLLTV